MKAQQRFPWIAVGAAASLLVVGTVAWLQIPATPKVGLSVAASAALPTLALSQAGSEQGANALSEQLSAYDPTVLFLPSAMNSGQKVFHPEGPSNDGGPFGDLGPQLVFSEQKAALPFPTVVPMPTGPVQALALVDRKDLPLVMGRTADGEGTAALPARAASLQAIRADDGGIALTLALPVTSAGPQTDWRPMELVGAVSRLGLVGGLTVTVSSGSATVDEYFADQLARGVRVGERLPPGFYTFRVGP